MFNTNINISKTYLAGIFILAAMMLPVWLDYSLTQPTERQLRGSDIYYIWIDGKQIAAGENPYARIHGSDMFRNNKYSTYLPGFFLFEVLLIKLGVTNFEQFFEIWRFSVTFIFCLIGFILYDYIFKKSGLLSLALFAALFWLVGRWSFAALRVWQIDFLAILFLLLALLNVNSRIFLALLFLGLSLSVKQIAIFVLPLFLIKILQDSKSDKILIIKQLFAVCLIPFLVSVPFMIWDFYAYFQSLFFSMTRNAGGFKMETIDQVLGITGVVGKIPLLFALFLVYILYFKAKISLAQSVLLAFLSFITFNPVLFKQYFPWLSAFVGLAVIDQINLNRVKPDKENLRQ